jgi:hypothetical protein
MVLADGLHAAHHLPLRHRIDRVDVEHPRLAVVVTLVHRVHPQITGLPLRVRFPPLADGHLARLGVRHVHPHTRIGFRVPQIANVRRRNVGQVPELRLAENRALPLQDAPDSRPREILVGGVYRRQQPDVRGGPAYPKLAIRRG